MCDEATQNDAIHACLLKNESANQVVVVVRQRERARMTKTNERTKANETGEQRVSMMRVNDSYLRCRQT